MAKKGSNQDSSPVFSRLSNSPIQICPSFSSFPCPAMDTLVNKNLNLHTSVTILGTRKTPEALEVS